MKLNLLVSIAIISFAQLAFAQCTVEPWSLEKRIDLSDVVVEGRVISQECAWDAQNHNIYTIHEIEVYKSFKGKYKNNTIKLVTPGGVIGTEMLKVSPVLELYTKDLGIFLLKKNAISIPGLSDAYQPTASVQSYIKIDQRDYTAYDYIKSYHSIKFDLYNTIKSFTNEQFQHVKYYDVEGGKPGIEPTAKPTISSFSVDSVSSGTETKLTINGSNFGFARGNGGVGFKDANFGDGRYYYPPISKSYISWSNSKIEVIVPTRAGTGNVRVTNTGNETGTSTKDLFVKWAHLNVLYPKAANDTNFYPTDHVNDNSAGGYTWQMTSEFSLKTSAVAAFTRSLEEWRCETGMNWNIGTNSSVDALASDNINIVRFTTFSDSKLGVCYSRYSGCFHSNGINWYVKELDIEFDRGRSWYYGTGSPSSFQYDFQSVTTHELGHGHQLGHVRDNNIVMHYSLGNGQRKANLVARDVEAGEYVTDKSVSSSPCGPGTMTAIAANACVLRAPDGDFTVSDTVPCPTTNVVFTDQTEGDASSYSWNFGNNASPATASTKGPHTVQYSTSGTKTITLITSNLIGKDTFSSEIEVQVAAPEKPASFLDGSDGCLGENTYSLVGVLDAETYEWETTSGGEIIGTPKDTFATINWKETGSQRITVKAKNKCGESAGLRENITIIDNPVSAFTENVDGLDVSFTNESTDADSVNWDFGDGSNTVQQNPNHQYSDQGSYTIVLKAINSCAENESDKTLNLTFRASISYLSKETSVYPNPIKSGDNLTIEGERYTEYEVYDLAGKLAAKGEIKTNKLKTPLGLSGNFMLKLQNKTATSVVKLKLE